MADTFASLRAVSKRKLTRSEQEALFLRTWRAAIEAVRFRPADLVGCGDHSCVVAPPRGMGTNGGCRCDERDLRRAVLSLRNQLTALNAEKVSPAAGNTTGEEKK